MKCIEYQENISGWLDGELDLAESQELRSHIEACDECRAFYEESAKLNESIQATLFSESQAASRIAENVIADLVPTAQSFETLETLESYEESQTAPAKPPGSLYTLVWFSSLAAALMLGFFLGTQNGNSQKNELLGSRPQPDVPLGDETTQVLPVAKMSFATGDVEFWEPGSTEYLLCPADTDVPVGSKMRTGSNFKCEIETSSGAKIRMDCDTEVFFPGEDELVLERGRIWCGTESNDDCKMTVQSGNASIGLIGAVCSVQSEGEFTECLPLRGKVAVQNGKWQAEVPAGKTLAMNTGEEPRLRNSENLIMETRWLNEILIKNQNASGELEERVSQLLAVVGFSKMQYLLEQELRALGSDGVPPLIAFLNSAAQEHQNLADRNRAAMLVKDLADVEHVPQITQLLKDDSAIVRGAAAAAILRVLGVNIAATPEQWSTASASEIEAWHAKHLEWIEQNQSWFSP
ncbi:MAG: zf-HC2 domain-containing protein [Planctomycetota bacterium]